MERFCIDQSSCNLIDAIAIREKRLPRLIFNFYSFFGFCSSSVGIYSEGGLTGEKDVKVCNNSDLSLVN